jgi:hypothetical protein
MGVAERLKGGDGSGRLIMLTVSPRLTVRTVSTIITIPLQRAGDGQVGGGLWHRALSIRAMTFRFGADLDRVLAASVITANLIVGHGITCLR